MAKCIFITGGVVSSLGKGIASASLGALLEARGLSVTMIKLDPYINVDPGTMSPFQHGEVFVTADGAETDLDMGHYERYTNAVNGGLAFLIKNKSAYGNWNSTQATILALKALILAMGGVGSDADMTVTVLLDGKPVRSCLIRACATARSWGWASPTRRRT